MKKIGLFIILAFTTLHLAAQGIDFVDGNWKSVIARAKKEHKLIYIDVYTTWCGPCKKLAAEIFPKKEVGDIYNPSFVSYRIDAEKGEGIRIAKKYRVHGYPTHLFINPVTEEIVYRGMGYNPNASNFNHHAEVAMAEYKDPMTWEKYTAKFDKEKKDRAFLKTYLEKAARLGKPNDAIMEAYINTLGNDPLSDADLQFIDEQDFGINSSAVPYLEKHQVNLNQLHPKTPDYFHERTKDWIYKTFERAQDTKNEQLLAAIEAGIQRYTPENKTNYYDYKTRFYAAVGDSSKEFAAACEEANFLELKPADEYAKEDKAYMERGLSSVRAQLVAAKVSEKDMDTLIKMNMAQYALNPPSINTAHKFNNLAWSVYEKHASNPAMIKHAMAWAEKAKGIAHGNPRFWPSFADTHAHLLFASGKKEEAIAMEQSAVDMAKSAGSSEEAPLQETLNQMKSGKL